MISDLQQKLNMLHLHLWGSPVFMIEFCPMEVGGGKFTFQMTNE